MIIERTCPICKGRYTAAPALSRKDNSTYICPECGTREALDIFGCDEEEKAKIIETIKNARGGKMS